MSTTALATPPEDETLAASIATWRRTVEAELKGVPFDKKLLTRTFEGITLQPLYTRVDISKRAAHGELLAKAPGAAPYLRGTRAAGYAVESWEVAQEIAAATPAEFNQRLREDLMTGQNAAVLFAATPVRPNGLVLNAAADLEAALAGVEAGVLPVHIDAGADATALGDLYLAWTQKQSFKGASLTGSVTADPLGVWAAAGALPVALPAAFDALAAWTKRAAQSAPALRTVGINAGLWAEAGGTAVQELAFALSTTVESLRALRDRGVALDVSVPRLRVTFGAGPQFLMEAAKFRAWRPLLTRIVVALGGDATLAGRATVHAVTTRWNKTRLDAHVNMLRVTTEAFAAVLGSVDSLHIAPYDGLDGVGTGESFARRIARNVHVMLAEEFGTTVPADPAGGSWCIESLTDELARKAWELFQGFEAKGGFSAALRSGELQKLAAAAAKEKAQAVGARRSGIVGTNLFPNLRETPLPASAVLAAAPAAAWSAEKITPAVAFRASAGFEKLRDASAAYVVSTGKRPRVFLAKMGPLIQHKGRADFAAGFFAPGGFELVAKQTFTDAAEAAKALAASGAEVAVLCSTDETYPELVPAFTAAARAACPNVTLVLAGLPADEAVKNAFAAAGIDQFIHLRASAEETLALLLKKIGAL